MKRIERFELAEILIPAGNTVSRFNFPDMPNLKGTFCFGIQVYTVDILALAPVSGLALPTLSQVAVHSFITLVDEQGIEFLKNIPAAKFNTIKFDLSTSTNFYETNAKQLSGQKVSWNKSYITFTGAAPANVAYCVGIEYVTSKPKPHLGCPHSVVQHPSQQAAARRG